MAGGPGGTAVELRLECTLRSDSLAPRGTSGERVGERGNPIKPSSSPRPSPPPSSEEREKTASVSNADFLNSTAVHPGPLPIRWGEGIASFIPAAITVWRPFAATRNLLPLLVRRVGVMGFL